MLTELPSQLWGFFKIKSDQVNRIKKGVDLLVFKTMVPVTIYIYIYIKGWKRGKEVASVFPLKLLVSQLVIQERKNPCQQQKYYKQAQLDPSEHGYCNNKNHKIWRSLEFYENNRWFKVAIHERLVLVMENV